MLEKEHAMRRKQILEVKEMNGIQAINEFLEEKKSINLTEQTLETYKLHLNYFADCFASFIDTKHYNQELWKELLLYFKEDENKSEQTVLSYCRSIRAFIYWCQDKEYSPICQLKLPRASEPVKEIYTDDELIKLLEKPSRNCSEVYYQSWVFVNFVMSTGLRLSSVLSLKCVDYIKKEKIIYIQEMKGRKGIRLKISDEMCSILDTYIRLFDINNDDYLFCTASGERMARRTMQDNIATYNRSKNVQKTSIHLFRHTFAVKYYQATHDVYALMLQLAHSDISTTQKYLKSLSINIVDNTDKFNPILQYSKSVERKKRRGKM